MQQKTEKSRIRALDGIRGLAIILVVLTHVNTQYINIIIPQGLHQIIFGSGVTGVSLLFILSGFLMAYIYPSPKSGFSFLQRRYTRIFPLFLTSVVVMLFLRLSPHLAWYYQLIAIFGFALAGNFIWEKIVRKFVPPGRTRIIFILFILLQILTGFIYLFWIMKQPPVVFLQQIPTALREGLIGLVNATLTLPFGNYIPMLEGVYWSLASEVYFYILYPLLCVPLILFFLPQKKWIKILAIILLLPFFTGLDLLSKKIFVLSMLQLPLCYYFITGITLGYLYKNKPDIINKAHLLFPGIFSFGSILLFLLILFTKPYFLSLTSSNFTPFLHMLWAFPLTFIIAVALNEKTALFRVLNSKILLFLGTISYSIYLSHTPVLHLVEDSIIASNTLVNVLVIIITLALTILVSFAWYHLLEKPYFLKRKNEPILIVAKKTDIYSSFFKKPAVLLPLLFSLIFTAVFCAYQSSFSFFSTEITYPSSIFVLPKAKNNQKFISMKENPTIRLILTSRENNLEMLAMHIRRRTIKRIHPKPQFLVFKIKEINQKNWLAVNKYKLIEINETLKHPFGFPLITDAKNKTYEIELSMEKEKASEYLEVYANEVNGVYKVNKAEMVKRPAKLISFFVERFVNAYQNNEAQFVLISISPIFFLNIFLLFTKNFLTKPESITNN